jgi:hypothetical protein
MLLIGRRDAGRRLDETEEAQHGSDRDVGLSEPVAEQPRPGVPRRVIERGESTRDLTAATRDPVSRTLVRPPH